MFYINQKQDGTQRGKNATKLFFFTVSAVYKPFKVNGHIKNIHSSEGENNFFIQSKFKEKEESSKNMYAVLNDSMDLKARVPKL